MKKFLKVYSYDIVFLEKIVIYFFKRFDINVVFFFTNINVIYNYKMKVCKNHMSFILIEVKIKNFIKILFILRHFKNLFYFI